MSALNSRATRPASNRVAPPSRLRPWWKPLLGTGSRNILILIATLAVLAPLALMLLTSVQDQTQSFTNPLSLPHPLRWSNYSRAWREGSLVSKALNSAIVSFGSVVLATVFGAACAYACARMRTRLVANLIVAIFAIGLVIPVQSGVVPLFLEMRDLRLLGTLAPMILVDAVMVMPVTVLLLTAFFGSVPRELEDAARIEGASRLRVLTSVVLPLARPSVVTSIILGLVTVWNDYFISLVFATDQSLQTLPLGLAKFHGDYLTDWPATLAYSVMTAAPVLLLYIVLQRHITDGLTAGALK